MLPYTEHGTGPVTLVLMPFLGGSQRAWTEVIETLGKHHRCITLDLPGFGEAAHIPGYTLTEMTDAVVDLLATLHLDRYLLVGHSMAGKVAIVLTRRILDGGTPLAQPTGLVLVAPSPPCEEPMSDSKRQEMLEAFPLASTATPEDDRKQAEKYIRGNVSRELPPLILGRTVDDVLTINRSAWAAWLEGGSKEDWSTRIGIINLPTLIIAGDDDSDLGPAAQRKYTEPRFPAAHLITVECNHLLPLEEPTQVAALISNFVQVF